MSQPGQLGLDATNTSEFRVATWDFSKFAEIIGGDTIATVNAISQEVPKGQPSLTIGTPSIVGNTVQASVSVTNGTVNTVYPTACRVTTAQGHVLVCQGDIVLIGLGFATGGGNVSIGGATGTYGGAGYALQEVISASGLGQTLVAVPTGGVELHAAAYGVSASNSAAANSTALAALTAALVAAGGGTARFPAGTIQFSSPWNLDQQALLAFKGVGSCQDGGGAATILVYTGSGLSSAISCHAARGIRFESMAIEWNNVGFTGYLMDFGKYPSSNSNTTNCALIDCNLRPSSDSLTGAAALLFLGWTRMFLAERTIFRGGQYNVLGGVDNGMFNNTILFELCTFENASVCSVMNWLQSWQFLTCTWEPIASNAAGAFTYNPALGPFTYSPAGQTGLTIINPWMGDDHPDQAGTWINVGTHGTTIIGGTIACSTLTTGVKVTANAICGLIVDNVQFNGNGGSSEGVDWGNFSGNSGFSSRGCKFYNITQHFPGTAPADTIYQDGGNLYVGTLQINTLTVSAGITTNSMTVTGAPTFPNMLTATQADFEAGVFTGWQNNLNCTLSVTTAAADHGTHSLKMLNNGVNGPVNQVVEISINCSNGLVAAGPGQSWTGLASFLAPVGTPPRLLNIGLYAQDSNHAFLGNFASSGTVLRDNSSTWQPVSCTGTTPAGTAWIYMIARWGDTAPNYVPTNEFHYADCFSISRSSSTTWQDPAANSDSLSITPATIQQTNGSLNVLASGTGTVNVNHGPGAGTGGTTLGGNVSAPDGVPTIAAGTGAGTSPTVSISGSDNAGVITITTGSTPAASATVATITFGTAFPVTPRVVVVTPAGPNAAALSGTGAVYEASASRSASSFVLAVGSSALAGATTYLFNYQVIG